MFAVDIIYEDLHLVYRVRHWSAALDVPFPSLVFLWGLPYIYLVIVSSQRLNYCPLKVHAQGR